MNAMRLKAWWRRAEPSRAPEDLVAELYRGLLGREADAQGLRTHADALRSGVPLAVVARGLAGSEEFAKKQGYLRVQPPRLPDLAALRPAHYHRNADGSTTFAAQEDADFDWIEAMILEHRYYDSFGVWSPVVDADKRVIAALVEGLGARTCLEIGCFTGPVLSLLAAGGIEVTGVEISHLAFVLAYPEVRNRIRYGDLLSIDLAGPFDAVLAMDILEHLNPLRLDRYLARIAALLARGGRCLVNSPMFGADDVFGEVSPPYLREWVSAGPGGFWRHLHCDALGWPMHGHLVWASPAWWEGRFAAHGLVRDRGLEQRMHAELGGFFLRQAPARRSFFLLRHADAAPASQAQEEAVAASLQRALAG
jgi:SAM-dependent methyltransferase